MRSSLAAPNRRSLTATLVALSVSLFLLWPASDAGAARSFARGQRVVFEGLVRDARGEPIPGIRVVLEASRSARKVPGVKRASKGLTRVATLTGEGGAYRIEWEWHEYYNSFRLLVVAGSGREPPAEDPGIVATVELGRLGGDSATIVTPLTVSDSTFVREHREFVASLGAADPRRIYEEMGKPDRVQRMRRGLSEEMSWFYFERGRVYRFLDGALAESEDFDPVKPF